MRTEIRKFLEECSNRVDQSKFNFLVFVIRFDARRCYYIRKLEESQQNHPSVTQLLSLCRVPTIVINVIFGVHGMIHFNL